MEIPHETSLSFESAGVNAVNVHGVTDTGDEIDIPLSITVQ
jgi:hypothetical protein